MSRLIISAMLIAAEGISIGSGRLVPTIAALVGLIGIVLGGLALARSTRKVAGSKPLGAITSGVAGLFSAAVGGLHAANSAGGVGTGNGLAGAIAAISMGLTSVVLATVLLTRSKGNRQGPRPPA